MHEPLVDRLPAERLEIIIRRRPTMEDVGEATQRAHCVSGWVRRRYSHLIVNERVAILGAGIQGTCLALELAQRGCSVDLYDKAPEPINAASRWNEGKIHLGFIFANDPSRRTAERMIRGSLEFGDLLKRWTGLTSLEGLVSEPFHYAVLDDSQLDSDEFAAHASYVSDSIRSAVEATGRHYLDQRGGLGVERLSRSASADLFATDRVRAAFTTPERSVDPHAVAEVLCRSIDQQARIHFHGDHPVEAVVPVGDSFAVVLGDQPSEPYDHVVNALWADRLRVDATLGIEPKRAWSFRYKVALHVRGANWCDRIPSTTMVLGPYGDVVNFGDGRLYLSWYPVGRLLMSTELVPPAMTDRPDAAQRASISREIWQRLQQLVPALSELDPATLDQELNGGYIFAWGDTDIDDRVSGLHQRTEIGPQSFGTYHSIDTGKYCMAPSFAMELADRIAPLG